MDTLFGHLALAFGSHPENLATEALHFVLEKSAETRRLLTVALARSGATLPEHLRFVTQAADDKGAIPDIVGLTPAGDEVVIVEAKFWAGLTARQPNGYLDRLPPGGLLVFVAPALRFDALWPELLVRCRGGGHPVEAEEGRGPNWRVARLAGDRRLALTSWRAVLADLHGGLVQAGETGPAADVLQLQGLTDRMDADAFLPFASEELTSNLGRRVHQLGQLVDAVLERLKAEKLADTVGSRASGGRHGEYNQNFKMYRAGCRVFFSPAMWALHGHPVWLEVRDGEWRATWPAANDALRPLALELPSRLLVTQWGAYVPLRVPTGVEHKAVVDQLTAQVREVAALLAGVV